MIYFLSEVSMSVTLKFWTVGCTNSHSRCSGAQLWKKIQPHICLLLGDPLVGYFGNVKYTLLEDTLICKLNSIKYVSRALYETLSFYTCHVPFIVHSY
jgi:hypothetical protein